MSRISTPDISLRLKDYFGTRGLPPIHNLDETIVPVAVVADLRTQETKGRRRHYWFEVVSVAVVGQTSAVALLNPTLVGGIPHRVLVAPTRVTILPESSATGGQHGRIRTGVLLAAEPAGNGVNQDVETRTGGIGAVFSLTSATGFTTDSVGIYSTAFAPTSDRITFDNVILHRGRMIMVIGDTLNLGCHVGWEWDEYDEVP